jgi:hypothetical protein
MVYGGGARSNSSTPPTVVFEIAIAVAVVAIAELYRGVSLGR